jgi:hypothetical protein
MADTIRSQAAILALLADNTAGDISAQDLRDAIVSLYAETPASMTVSAFDTETTSGTLNPSYRRIVRFTDSIYSHAEWNGSAWEYYHGHFKCTRPDDSAFAWINQGSATVSSATGAVRLTAPASASQSHRIRKKAAPSTPYTITAAFLCDVVGADFNFIQLGWRQSSDGKLVHLRFGYNSGFKLDVVKGTSTTADSAVYTTQNMIHVPRPLWLRINDDGANRVTSWSFDGTHYTTLHTVGRTDFATGDEVFWSVDTRISSRDIGASLIHWAQS